MMDDDPETSPNPYQSPRSDLTAEEEAAGPERVYGLRQPIRIQGKLLAEDVRRAEDMRENVQATTSQKVKTGLWVLVALAIIVLLGARLLLESGSVALVAGFALFLLLGSLALWLLVAYSRKGYARHVERNAVLETTTFTDERGLSARMKSASGRQASSSSNRPRRQ